MRFGCGLEHIQLLLGIYACNVAVVLDPYQQTSAIAIGKSTNGAGNFWGIINSSLEVLLLVLSFGNHLNDKRHDQVDVSRKALSLRRT